MHKAAFIEYQTGNAVVNTAVRHESTGILKSSENVKNAVRAGVAVDWHGERLEETLLAPRRSDQKGNANVHQLAQMMTDAGIKKTDIILEYALRSLDTPMESNFLLETGYDILPPQPLLSWPLDNSHTTVRDRRAIGDVFIVDVPVYSRSSVS